MGFANLFKAIAHGGTGSTGMDLASSIAQSPRVNEILSRYGLMEPRQIDDSVMPVAKDSFLGNHPLIHRGIENALLGAALTKPSSTPGEAISNIAQGVLGIGQAHEQASMSRVMAPIQMATTLSQLDENDARAEYYRQGGRAAKTSQDVWTNVKVTEDRKHVITMNNHTGEMKVVPVPDGYSIGNEASPHETMTQLYRKSVGRDPSQKNMRGSELEDDIAGARATLGMYTNTQATIAGAGANARLGADRRWGGISDVQSQVLKQYDQDASDIDQQIKSVESHDFKKDPIGYMGAYGGSGKMNLRDREALRQQKLNDLRNQKNDVMEKKKAYGASIGINVGVPSPAPSAPPKSKPASNGGFTIQTKSGTTIKF